MKRCILALAMLVAATCAHTAEKPPAFNAETVRQILIQRVDTGKLATGIVVGIIGPDGRLVVAYGSMGIGDPRPVSGDTVFPIASVTKLFTSLLLADMVERGEVALADPVGKYLPSELVTVPTRNGKQITLIDLATNTSGLPAVIPNYRLRDGADPSVEWLVENGYKFLSNHALARDIGTRYEYTDFGVALMGHSLALRAATGYEELVRARITAPLGMKDTSIALSTDMKHRLASGHDTNLVRVPDARVDLLQGAGALHSTLNDMLNFLEAFLGYRDSVQAPAMKAMLEPRRPGGFPPSTHTALGWMIVPTSSGEIAWHAGQLRGYRTFAGIDRAKRLGVVVLSNGGADPGVYDIGLHLLHPQFALYTPIVQTAINPQVLDRYVGRYEFSPSFAYTVTREGSRLFIQPTGFARNEMFAKGEHGFFLREMNAQVVFESVDDGPARALVFHNRVSGRDSRAMRAQQ